MALVNPNIAMSYRGVELPQQNALADYAAIQQIQGGQRQAELSQMQIDAMRRDEATLKQIQETSIKHGGPTDLGAIADAYLKSGNPKFVEFGVGLRQKLDEKQQFANIMGGKFGAAPAAAAAPASEPYPGYNESIGMAAPAAAAAPANEPYPGYNQAIGMTPSVNAMAPAATPVTNALADVAMLRQRRDAFLSMGTPQAIAAARALDSDIALASKPPVRQVVSAGSTVLGPDNKVVYTAPAALPTPLDVTRLIKERDALPKGDPNIAIYNAAIRKQTEFAPRAITNVNLPPQQNAFEGELGKGQAKSIVENRAVAQDAASIIETVNTGRDILKGKIITGAGADFLVNFNQALKTAGVDFGYADAAANSQAYAANMAQNVGKIIKQFGAGTGLSDADRQYAEKMAGGKITLDAKALNKILDINERAARNVITRHNKDVEGIKTNIPLTVEMPAKRAEVPITAVNPTTGARIQSTDGGKTWTALGGS
jgi:hypothetical protein